MQTSWASVRRIAAGLGGAFVLSVSGAAAGGGPILIGLDAEFGHKTSTSAQSIRQGMEIAIDEINAAGGLLGGRKLELVVRDNRSIPAIGVDNLRELAALPELVGVFGGKFSPVVQEWLPVAHELGIPVFATWSSANSITDHGYKPSWSFRLSLKDAWAAPVMLRHARDVLKVRKVGVLVPNIVWGRSNSASLRHSAPAAGMEIVGERWYNWGDASLKPQLEELLAAGAEAVILIANEVEGSILVREMASLPVEKRVPIVSHWGITGGMFTELSGPALDKVDIAVVQTYSFVGDDSATARRVLTALKRNYGIDRAESVKGPVGVAHAYDLVHLIAQAIRKAGSTERARVRTALEQLGPHQGLVRRYVRPFTPDNHDALSADQVFMARYAPGDRLIPIGRGKTH
jgi:branched-chain amino acid transport system substrate-binding protein